MDLQAPSRPAPRLLPGARAVLGLGLAGTMLQAEDPRMGVQVRLVQPGGTFASLVEGPAWGAGLLATLHLDGAHVVRPRLDWQRFGTRVHQEVARKAEDWRMGADYLHFLHEKPEGGYLLAGVSLHRWTVDTQQAAQNGGGAPSGSQGSSHLGFSCGFGSQLTREVGAEVQYVLSRASGLPAGQPGAAYWVGSLTYRF